MGVWHFKRDQRESRISIHFHHSQLMPLVAFVAEVRIESFVINVRAVTNLPFFRTSRQFCRTERAAHDQTTYPCRGRSVWPETALSSAALPTSRPADQF